LYARVGNRIGERLSNSKVEPCESLFLFHKQNLRSMFKKHKVVMLPTEKASRLFIVNDKKLYNNGQLAGTDIEVSAGSNYINQHLYILSDEEIKEPCYAYCIVSNTVEWLSNLQIKVLRKESWKKIISSTDSSLRTEIYNSLPRPSDSFIKKYCELGGIDEVMVEYYKDGYKLVDTKEGWKRDEDSYELFLKVAPDNTITIKRIRDSWNKEEVIEKLRAFSSWKTRSFTSEDIKWIEENL